MPRNTRPPAPRSSENNYGGHRPHRVEHDPRIEQNFSRDNQDYTNNGAQYNDRDERRFNDDNRMAHDHHDRPERVRRYQDEEEYRPSNYSEGGHGRKFDEQPRPRPHRENNDNRDYSMNKDSERGAQQRYNNSGEQFSNQYSNQHSNQYSRDHQNSRDDHRDNRKPPRDERYRQSDWAPQDRYNEIAPDRHREAAQDRYQPQLNTNPNQDFNYHYNGDNHDSLEQEPRRRGRHYREY